MIKKLKQKKGETLVETMFSLMIAVLCVGLIYSAVLSATRINQDVRKLDEKYDSELIAVEGFLEEGVKVTEKDVVITFQYPNEENKYTEEVKVSVYGNDDSAFLSYIYKGDGQ